MSHFATLPSNLVLLIHNTAKALLSAPHGTRGAVINNLVSTTGWSKNKCWQAVKWAGYSTGRKKRVDSGKTQLTEEQITFIGVGYQAGLRKNGKQTLKTTTLRSIGAASGMDFQVSNSQINRVMKARHMSMQTLQREEAYQEMKSLHPNHVHGVDPSLCLLYYTPQGRQKVLHDDEIYKNKPEWVERVGNMKCWRYVMVDHASGVVSVKYYQSAGETAEDMFDFVLWCWSKHDNRHFHGVPKMLSWDKGSASKSIALKNALKALEVDTFAHAAGNAKANGFVEKMQNEVETQFESRLYFEPVGNIDELNAAALDWQNAYNANLLSEQDTRVTRKNGKQHTRYDLWKRITQEQLRLLPDANLCRYLLSKPAVSKTVQRNLTIKYSHPQAKQVIHYDVSDFEGIAIGESVQVRPLAYKDNAILIEHDGINGLDTFEVFPKEISDFGFFEDAAVWGEGFKSPKKDITQLAKDALEKAAYPGLNEEQRKKAAKNKVAPFNGNIKAITQLKQAATVEHMPKQGTDLQVPNPIIQTTQSDTLNQPATRFNEHYKMNPLAALKWLRAHPEFKDEVYPQLYAYLKDTYKDGVTELELEQGFINKPLLILDEKYG